MTCEDLDWHRIVVILRYLDSASLMARWEKLTGLFTEDGPSLNGRIMENERQRHDLRVEINTHTHTHTHTHTWV